MAKITHTEEYIDTDTSILVEADYEESQLYISIINGHGINLNRDQVERLVFTLQRWVEKE